MFPVSTFVRRFRLPAILLSAISFCLLLTCTAEVALATTMMLHLSPVRAIFTDKERSLTVNVSNNSQEAFAYTISVVTMRKDKNGDLREVLTESSEEQMIRGMIRFSPRQATIEPGKRQVIKLMVQKPANLPSGEYQTRLRLSPRPLKGKAGSNSPSRGSGGATFQIDVLVASTIPIIIQHDAKAEITPVSCSLKDDAKNPSGLAAEVKFARSGNASAFGNVRLFYTPAQNSQASREIGRVQSFFLYLPEKERTMAIPLTGITRKELTGGAIRVEFEPDTGAGVKKRLKEGDKTFKDFPVR